jgi:hypothetical protein
MPRILSLSALNERLAMAIGSGAALQDLRAPAPYLGIQLIVRDHCVDEPEGQCLLRGVAPAQIPDFARLLFPHYAREISGAETGIDRADLRADLAEHGLFRGDGEIANRSKYVAAADGVALHTGNDRLRYIANYGM